MPEKADASAPIATLDDLCSFFPSAGKPREEFLLGVEHEKIPITAAGRPIAYDGAGGVVELLTGLAARGFVLTRDGENGPIIGANRAGEDLSLEPGLQIELSAPPLATARACQELVRRHIGELTEVGRALGIGLLWGGFRPWGRLDEIPWLPKARYDIMREYLPRQGRFGHDMMKRTATVQVNLDFADEADAADTMRTAMGITSIVTALYAASPITEGRPNGYKTFRAGVWLDMDEARCGLIPAAFEPGFGFRAYAEWAASVPMFFLSRGGRYHPLDGLTFHRFLVEGWQGHRATMADWALHLSTLFPEVRLKRTIELRGADGGPMSFVEALPALWRGLLYDRDARHAAWALVERASYADRQELRRQVPRAGLSARFLGHDLASLARELCTIAAAGLRRLPGGEADVALLEPIASYARAGRSPADDMLATYAAANGDPARLIEAWTLPSTV